MTKTYFVRHSSGLDVDKKTLDEMWDGDYFGIHYPFDKSEASHKDDSFSLDPSGYEGSAKSSLERMHMIAKEGGYVFAAYRGHAGGKVGYVKPGSSVELFAGHWNSKNGQAPRPARLKVIKLEKSRNLSAEQSISLKSVQPRQGALCQWRKVGSRVEAILTGVISFELGSLTPDLQEVMCMEYLRSEMAGRLGLPTLKYTLSPVGRTLKDIDILGVSSEGKIISAQVTFSALVGSEWKLKKLNAYESSDSHTIYFCKCEKSETRDGHLIFPIGVVFEEFCNGTDAGRQWFKLAAGA